MKKLRRCIRLIALILTLLLLVPMGYSAYSLVVYGTRWRTSEYNTYLRSQKTAVTAGSILDRSGVVLASTGEDGNRTYAADAAVRSAMVHVVGDSRGNIKNAAESFMTEYLYGLKMSFTERLTQLARNGTLRGDTITLTCSSELSAYAASLFPKGKSGAIVVMNYKTGELIVLESFPNYDPTTTARVNSLMALNHATRWLSAPGSTFKIVTLASALQNLPGVTTRTFQCSGLVDFGSSLRMVSDYGGEAHGTLSLRAAFLKSCNSTFSMLAYDLGDSRLRQTAADFGIGDDFTFRDLVVENSSFSISPAPLLGADLGWTGVGQNELQLTPLHMCMIASAVANKGIMMEPRLLLKAETALGSMRTGYEAKVYKRVLSAEVAQ